MVVYTPEERAAWRENRASPTFCDPDGPKIYVDYLDEEVGTFLDPRNDLKNFRLKTVPTLMHHVPFKKRGMYKPEWLPQDYYNRIRGSVKTDLEGYVVCGATTRYDPHGRLLPQPRPCIARAVNRCNWCRHHGGALHPGDKKISGQSLAPVPQDRIEKLDRVQKFMQGFLKFEDL